MRSRERLQPDTMRREMTAAHEHEASGERRREWVLARLYCVLPSLYSFVRRQLTYREAVADLAPGALPAEQVIDHVVVRAYMASTIAEDDDIAVTVRRLALDEIHAHLPERASNGDRPTVLYFFQSNGDGRVEPSSSGLPASVLEEQAENDAVRRSFENAVAGMPAVWRQVMLLHHVDGLAGPALARAVGRSESDVQRVICHAGAYLASNCSKPARWPHVNPRARVDRAPSRRTSGR